MIIFAFLGLAKCSDCGSAITAERHTKFYRRTNRKAVYRYYRCGKKLLERLGVDEIKEKHLAKSKIKQLKFQLEIVDQKLERLLDGYLEKVVDTKSANRVRLGSNL